VLYMASIVPRQLLARFLRIRAQRALPWPLFNDPEAIEGIETELRLERSRTRGGAQPGHRSRVNREGA
jgi:hypothetical protein